MIGGEAVAAAGIQSVMIRGELKSPGASINLDLAF
jgi:hypothetical protein